MRKKIALVVGALAFLIPIADAGGYNGPECSGTLPPGWTHVCAYHTHVRRVVVYANGNHWVWFGGKSGICSGNCTADTGYLRYARNGRATIGNTSNRTIYFHGWAYP